MRAAKERNQCTILDESSSQWLCKVSFVCIWLSWLYFLPLGKLLWMLLWLYSGHDVALTTFKLGSWWFVDFIQTGWRGWANYGWLDLSSLGQIQIDFNRFSTTSNRNVWSLLPSLIMCQRVVWQNVKTHQSVLQKVKVRRILKLNQNSEI